MTLTQPAAQRNGHEAMEAVSILEWVDPEVAQFWITRNRKNRTLYPGTVSRYARDMIAGRWNITGEAIKFDVAGNIIDGQHRLHAILESGATIQTFVVRNLPPEAQDVMDTGRKRTAGDALGLNGHGNAHLTAAAIRLAMAYEAGLMRTSMTARTLDVTNAEALAFIQENPDMVEAAHLAAGRFGQLQMRPSVIAFTVWALRRVDEEAAMAFFEDLVEYRTSGTGDPRLALLRRLRNAQDAREDLGSVTQAFAVFRAWNAVRRGERLTSLVFTGRNGPSEFRGPESGQAWRDALKGILEP